MVYVVMVKWFMISLLATQVVMVYEGKEVRKEEVSKRKGVTGAGVKGVTESARGYSVGKSYGGYSGVERLCCGTYTGDGSYGEYSGDDAQGYSGEKSYTGHSKGYGGGYDRGYDLLCREVYDKRCGGDEKLVIQHELMGEMMVPKMRIKKNQIVSLLHLLEIKVNWISNCLLQNFEQCKDNSGAFL